MTLEQSEEIGTAVGLVDLLELGFGAQIAGVARTDLDNARYRLAQAGILDAARSAAGGPNCLVLRVPCPERGVETGDIATLALLPGASGHLRIANSSAIRLHPMRILRERFGLGIDLPSAFDGKDNYIGEFPKDCTALFEAQRSYIVSAVECLLDALDNAFPNSAKTIESAIWLRRVEACSDVAIGDVTSMAQLLAYSSVACARTTDRSVYRSSHGTSGGHTVGRWWRKKRGGAAKIYAKAPDLLRFEFSCLDRDAIAAETGACNAPLDGEGVGQLLDHFMEVARPHLAELRQHAQTVLESTQLPADFAMGMRPLINMISGESTGGRPVASGGIDRARDAFNSLLLNGSCQLIGLRRGTRLRSILDALCGEGGPLAKHAARCTYAVHPAHARAAFAFGQASVR